jgi:hypothetical protein
VRRFGDTRAKLGEGVVPGVFGLLASVGEIVAEPENLEGALRKMVDGLRDTLGLRAISISASFGEGRRISATSGMTSETAAEFPILRGKTLIGTFCAYPDTLDNGQREALRAAAGIAAAHDAAHAGEVAAQKTAQGSLVQIASEALDVITEEKDLYRTVLVLTLELLDASGGAILLGDGGMVSLGFEGSEGTLEALRGVRRLGRSPWMSRMGGYHLLGVGIGNDEGAVFLARSTRPYTEAGGISLKLVARQVARARERSRLYASLERTTTEAISALAAALESRDDTAGEHIRRTHVLAGEVASEIGLAPRQVRVVQYASMLHDIGKIGIPDSILNKPGRLRPEEWGRCAAIPRSAPT